MRILYLTLCVLVLDQATKLAVKGVAIPGLGVAVPGVPLGSSTPLLGNWLKLTFVENPNMAFGMSVLGPMPLVLFAIAASIGLVYYLWRHRNDGVLARAAIALIIAGAIGNIIDRLFYGIAFGYAPLFYGRVVDFIDVDLFTAQIFGSPFKFWPIFNVADSAVTVGAVLLLFFGLRPAHATIPATAALTGTAPSSGAAPLSGPAPSSDPAARDDAGRAGDTDAADGATSP